MADIGAAHARRSLGRELDEVALHGRREVTPRDAVGLVTGYGQADEGPERAPRVDRHVDVPHLPVQAVLRPVAEHGHRGRPRNGRQRQGRGWDDRECIAGTILEPEDA